MKKKYPVKHIRNPDEIDHWQDNVEEELYLHIEIEQEVPYTCFSFIADIFKGIFWGFVLLVVLIWVA